MIMAQEVIGIAMSKQKPEVGDIILIGKQTYLVIDCRTEDTDEIHNLCMLNLKTFELHAAKANGYIPSSFNIQNEGIDLGKIFRDIIYNNKDI